MKLLKQILGIILFLVLCFASISVSAQCVPDSSITSNGIFPDTLEGTCVGIPYEETITIRIPVDTVAMGFTATIDSLVLDSVAGLPAGLDFFCLNDNCVIEGGGTSCVLVSGTPTQAGTYPIDLYVAFFVKLFNSPVIQRDTLEAFYTLVINPELTTTTSTTPAMCGMADGTATVNATGTAPYSYQWSNGATTATATGLAAGIYTVTTEDVNGCSVINTVEVQNSGSIPSISIDAAAWSGCSESGGGVINLTTSGGTGPYTYAWSNGSIDEDLSGLPADTYTVTVTDANNCTDIDVITITQPTVMEVAITNQTDILCAGDNTGAIEASLSGGQTPFTTSWNTSPPLTGLSIANIGAGAYTLTVTDDLGCMKTASATLTEPAPLTIAIVDTSESAAGALNGSATATASGGTPPYVYSWDNGETTARIDSLASGTYILTVTDANNCVLMDTVDIQQWAVGIEDELAAGISSLDLFPNPSSGVFTLSLALQNYDRIELTVFDLQGNKLLSEKIESVLSMEKSYDLRTYASGLYLIQIKSSKGMASRKIMLK